MTTIPRFDFSRIPDAILLDLCATAVKKAADQREKKGDPK